jgi:hypothetical protein
MVLGCLGVIGMATSSGTGAKPGSPGRPTKSAPEADASASDPYDPDCAIVRRWLRANYGSVEAVSWGKRTISRMSAAGLGDTVTLTATFRVKGERGKKTGLFIIGPGDVVISSSISD